MDDAVLISAIFKRPILWDPMEELHKHPGVLRKLWEEVAQEVEKDMKSVKNRWKNLRTYFIRECKKTVKPRYGDAAEASYANKSSWHLFKQLQFLKSVTGIPEQESCLPLEVTVDDTFSSTADEDPIEVMAPTPIPTEFYSNNYNNTLPLRKRKLYIDNSAQIEDLLEVEREKIKLLQNEAEKPVNDDSLFFESLLPYLKDIPQLRKLRLRSKIQELVLAELEQNVPSTSNPLKTE